MSGHIVRGGWRMGQSHLRPGLEGVTDWKGDDTDAKLLTRKTPFSSHAKAKNSGPAFLRREADRVAWRVATMRGRLPVGGGMYVQKNVARLVSAIS
ncbi:hypothetical protein ColKHC_05548 [Colletotrichum higginsianum]|nr:hypothetical protein ColKHC_05548 [Colletotrichum higginsianum]